MPDRAASPAVRCGAHTPQSRPALLGRWGPLRGTKGLAGAVAHPGPTMSAVSSGWAEAPRRRQRDMAVGHEGLPGRM